MASSLYDKCLTATCRMLQVQYPAMSAGNVEDVRAAMPEFFYSHIPVPLQRDLLKKFKQIWMKETPLPMDPRQFDCRHLNFHTLDKRDFIMLTNIPPEDSIVPHFWSATCITGHVNFDYYEFWVGSSSSCSNIPYNLCRQCFVQLSTTDDDDFDYEQYWRERGWKFYNVTSHYGCQPEKFVETVLKRETSWCDFCVLTPLFRLYDWDQCTEYTNVHEEKWIGGSDDDDDSASSVVSEESVINICTKTKLYDPYHI